MILKLYVLHPAHERPLVSEAFVEIRWPMRVPWPTAGSLQEFVLCCRAHRRLSWLSDSGSSIDGNGVTGGGRCREGH